MKLTQIHVYRFHDQVAFNPADGPTRYLTPDEARAIAAALQEAADNIESCQFAGSSFGTRQLPAGETR